MSREKDPLSGIVTEWYAKPDGNVYVRKLRDAVDVVDRNKKLQNMHDGTYKNSVNVVASVPILLAEQWAAEAGLNMYSKEFDAYMKRKLNTSDFKYLKTVNGKI